jgi:monofunctional biosynthetic peptidoglycan transglycosylase
MRKRSITSRLLRLLAFIAFAWVALTASVVAALRWIDPPTSTFMLQERWRQPDQKLRHAWTDWDRIAGPMKVAVIAAEDQRFPTHHGFDLESIDRALAERERGRIRGASTISQQVAKNLFLWPGRSWLRKGLEAYFTVLIETLWPKRRILEVYLNIAEFGRGIYGVDAASQTFFGKPAARLTTEEAALLAAVLPSPKRFHANAPSAYVRSRQQWILEQMRSLGGTAVLAKIE